MRQDEMHTPNLIPISRRIGSSLGALGLAAYGAFGIWIDDLLIPGKRSSLHLSDIELPKGVKAVTRGGDKNPVVVSVVVVSAVEAPAADGAAVEATAAKPAAAKPAAKAAAKPAAKK